MPGAVVEVMAATPAVSSETIGEARTAVAKMAAIRGRMWRMVDLLGRKRMTECVVPTFRYVRLC
jgi:hypothetical protein